MDRNVRRVVENIARVFELHELDDIDSSKVIKELENFPNIPDKQIVLKFFLEQIFKCVPNKIINFLKKDAFSFSPLLKKNETKYVAGGYVNSVYKLSFHIEGVEKELALLLHRPRFKNTHEALEHAKKLKRERDFYAQLYANIPGIVPQEQYFIYRDYRGRPSIMCSKYFESGKLRDLRRDVTPEELREIMHKNKSFENQLRTFFQISMDNINTICANGLDIGGDKNILISGTDGKEKLVLMDPHNTITGSEISNYIRDFMKYIDFILNQN